MRLAKFLTRMVDQRVGIFWSPSNTNDRFCDISSGSMLLGNVSIYRKVSDIHNLDKRVIIGIQDLVSCFIFDTKIT